MTSYLPKTSKSAVKFLAVILGSNLLVLLGILAVFKASGGLVSRTLGFFQPQISEPEISDRALLLNKIQLLSELTTTVYQLETIVPTSADLVWGNDWTIATTKLLYLAQGEVRAGIDLEQITVEDLEIQSDRLILNLPPATILDSKLDVNNSRVYHYDRGWLNLGPDVAPKLQTLAQQKTIVRMEQQACQQDILNSANQKAQTTLENFLNLTTQKQIEVKITPSPQC